MWPDNMNKSQIDIIIEKGPTRVHSFEYPRNEENRHFSDFHYKRVLSNGEHVDRRWLVYSKTKNSVFCFCCKIFQINFKPNFSFGVNGFQDWKHLSSAIETHEQSQGHLLNFQQWVQSELQMKRGSGIDEKVQKMIMNETLH